MSNPRMTQPSTDLTANDDGLRQMYRHRFSEFDRRKKDFVWRTIVNDFLQRWVAPQDVVADIGCGHGEFLNHIRCGRRIGVDLNTDAQDALAPGIEFHASDVCDLSFLDDDSVDVVFTSNMLEHLRSKSDVERTLREMRRVLRPGAHLIALGPNLRFLGGKYWDFWDHYTEITDRSLVEVLLNLDFELVDRYPKFLPYTTRSLLPKSAALVRLYLRTPLAWHLLGKQFLVRAAKRA
jgi:dolichol-phosphate mannosyltransferase